MERKKYDATNMPWLLFLLSVVFLGCGTVAVYFGIFTNEFTKDKPAIFIAIGCVLFAAGVFLLVVGIIRTIAITKYNKLLKDSYAYVTEANFEDSKRSSTTIMSAGNVPARIDVYNKVYYSYTDERGIVHYAKSVKSYLPKEVEFLKNKKKFKIKCHGDKSVIIEELPYVNDDINI